VVYIYNSQTQARRHVDEALKILKGLYYWTFYFNFKS
jgi:hypothetical protein